MKVVGADEKVEIFIFSILVIATAKNNLTFSHNCNSMMHLLVSIFILTILIIMQGNFKYVFKMFVLM